MEERLLVSEMKEIFDEEVFKKKFPLDNIDLSSCGDAMHTVFGMLIGFKDGKLEFVFRCDHSMMP